MSSLQTFQKTTEAKVRDQDEEKEDSGPEAEKDEDPLSTDDFTTERIFKY